MPRVRRILAVEDNPDVLRVQTALLRAMGHEVLPVSSAAEAIEAADSFLPEIVLIDIGLPDMDGYELAKRLRQLPATRTARLIALTGYGSADAKRQAEEAGIDDFFVKPVPLAHLYRALKD
ncbi:MAG TPA: response regulator [Pirellulales bacterium]|jgi:CheY-like chemotaxis protein|nr:response regulator [Pirellulales bacterium]